MEKPYKVLLYYKYVPIEDVKGFVVEHKKLCTKLGLKGRVLIGDEGINGTVAGTREATDEYIETLHSDERFSDMPFKTHGSADIPFPKLKVRYRPEIVTLEAAVDPANGGEHLTPAEWHELAQRDDVVILDASNDYEAAIGKFKDAVIPDIQNFREFPEWVEKNKEQLSGKKVLMYCTGGIRCEKASVVVKDAVGSNEVYQLQGGIIEYGKEVGDGIWEGSCFVFDERMKVPVGSTDYQVISVCRFCDKKTDNYYNCCNAQCNQLILLCAECEEKSNAACSEECSDKHRDGKVKHWDIKTRVAVGQ